ncbi:MAG: hypothetical protein HUU43_15215 [Ignavibacteriaceae bacterium]|nr:hypothetical protein [Ignavibacteriaceae bacterium]
MADYFSKYKNFSISDGKRKIRFLHNGLSGIYSTSSKDEIEWLEKQPNYNRDFFRIDKTR